MEDIKVVCVTGAAGRIAYSLIPLLCNGLVFGSTTKLVLNLFDIPLMKGKLDGYVLEIEDCGFPCLEKVIASTESSEAFLDADVVILLGGAPRGPGMERSEMIAINAAGIAEQARSLETYAKPSVKVLVVANPANTNTIVAMNAAPKLRSHQFSCLTRLDHERLRGMASHFCGGAKVRDVAIWGNHSQTQVPYLLAATVTLNGVSRKLAELDGASEFMQAVVPRVQRRGADIIKATGTSSAMSAATAIGYHLADWLSERPSSELFSMGMLSNGNAYAVPPGIVFSFPCHRLRDGEVVIAEGLPITSEMQAMMDQTVEELLAEKREAEAIVGTICVLDSRL